MLMSNVMTVGIKVAAVVIFILAAALIAGLALDRVLEMERNIFTFLFVLLSIPITMWALYKISMSAVAAIEEEKESRKAAANQSLEDEATE